MLCPSKRKSTDPENVGDEAVAAEDGIADSMADRGSRERVLTMHCLVLRLNPRGTGLEEWTPGFEDWLVQDQSRGHQCGGRSLHENKCC